MRNETAVGQVKPKSAEQAPISALWFLRTTTRGQDRLETSYVPLPHPTSENKLIEIKATTPWKG